MGEGGPRKRIDYRASQSRNITLTFGCGGDGTVLAERLPAAKLISVEEEKSGEKREKVQKDLYKLPNKILSE